MADSFRPNPDFRQEIHPQALCCKACVKIKSVFLAGTSDRQGKREGGNGHIATTEFLAGRAYIKTVIEQIAMRTLRNCQVKR